MSTKIFVVSWTGARPPGKQLSCAYTLSVAKQAKTARVGLARALSKLGYCSRSQAFELIRSGRVQLNGNTAKNPEAPVRLGRDNIAVDHQKIAETAKLYWMLNKPRGTVTTREDEQGRETVYAGLPKHLPWMGPVGRLDRASEGLLLFTNDSQWSAKITSPESHLDKTYHVQVAAVADASLCESLMTGIQTGDAEPLQAKKARLVRAGEKNSWIEIVLIEGRNRQIRRMLEARGVEVLRLIRVAMGQLELGVLGKGQARALTKEEKNRLDRALRAAVEGGPRGATGEHRPGA